MVNSLDVRMGWRTADGVPDDHKRVRVLFCVHIDSYESRGEELMM